jgi:glycosyltransferase involved in cell wall biosynthesis
LLQEGVTVVVPAYNSAKYLKECLLSVLGQDFKALEVVVVNDGSTDGTLEIFNSIQTQNVTVITQENSGIAISRNVGLSIAKFRYICFLDSDDIFYPNKIRKQYDYMTKFNVVGVGTQMNYIGETGRKFGVTGIQAQNKSEEIMSAILMPFPISSAMFLTSEAQNLGGFNTSFKQVEDLEFLSRIAERGNIHTLMEPLGAYRLHKNSISSTKFAEQRQIHRELMASKNEKVRSAFEAQKASKRSINRAYRSDLSAMHFRVAGMNLVHMKILSSFWSFFLSFAYSPKLFKSKLRLRLSLLIRNK